MQPLGVVEDSPEDFPTFALLLRQGGCERPVVHFESGEEALDALRGVRTADERASLSCLLLADLNLSGCSGLQLVQSLKGDPALRHIPLVVLSTSAHASDIEGCYAAGANAYVQKPLSLERYAEVLRTLLAHWLDVVLLASGSR